MGGGRSGNKSEFWDHQLWGDGRRKDKEETIRKPLKGQTDQGTMEAWKSVEGKIQGKGIHEFMYPMNVAVRRAWVTFAGVVSREWCKSLVEVWMK